MSLGAAARLLSISPSKRYTFFSFHYKRDLFRVNIVRNSNVIRSGRVDPSPSFFDASLWEKSERTNPDSLKNLIRSGMDRTSVACILAGTETWSRRWVRYELAQTIVQKKGLLTVKIHGLSNMSLGPSAEGPNPCDYIGLYRVADGKVLLAERARDGSGWVRYQDYQNAVEPCPQWAITVAADSVVPISRFARCYDYQTQSGYDNLGSWVSTAAMDVGR